MGAEPAEAPAAQRWRQGRSCPGVPQPRVVAWPGCPGRVGNAASVRTWAIAYAVVHVLSFNLTFFVDCRAVSRSFRPLIVALAAGFILPAANAQLPQALDSALASAP